MFDLSFDSANQLYGWSNIALIIGAVAVLAGTIGVIWATGVRDRYADQRISKNEADTALANAEVAKASAEAANAFERTKIVEMDLEKQRERAAKAETDLLALKERLKPRHFMLAQRTRLVDVLSRGEKGEISIDFMAADAESEQFAR